AAHAMELGYDAVLLNTAVAKAGDPVAMARAMGLAVEAGRMAYKAGSIEPRDMAAPSNPLIGMAVLQCCSPNFTQSLIIQIGLSACCRLASSLCRCASRMRPKPRCANC